jgi:aminobenzoyl-glutamate utilization protein B
MPTDRPRPAAFRALGAALLLAVAAAPTLGAQARPDPRLERLKREALEAVAERAPFTARLVDQLFSFGELGFQEVETSRHLVDLLRREGFTVEEGISGMPTAWVARWGAGRPVIALGSDIDAIPQASQMPGVACRLPMVPGAPGHGEGHNSGQAVNLTAALAVKRLMERERLPGTLVLWPGVAEEQLATKGFFARDGLFRGVDASFFTHVWDDFSTPWGFPDGYSGMISLVYSFRGISAHGAGAPWRGRSALDAVELMNLGWNFRREHLRPVHRSHYVIPDGGDQPNVVPSSASVWYFLRELDAPRIRELRAVADSVAAGAALMTGTALAGTRVIGSAWPPHFNRPLAEALGANIGRVGMPRWSEDDQRFARALQREMGVPESGLATAPKGLVPPPADDQRTNGGSDDIGDVSWAVPTAQLFFPANIPGTPGHNWADAVAMATPVAHKGATAGAAALALTLLDVLLDPALVPRARAYYEEQTREVRYEPFVGPDDRPAVELNAAIQARFREPMRAFHYDPTRHASYLDQLGVTYPTLRGADGRCAVRATP